MGAITQEFSGDTTKLERAYEKLHRENAKLLNEQQKLATNSQQNHASALAIGDRVVGQLATMAMGYLSVGEAINTVNRALEEKRRLGQEALTTQLTVADAEAEAILNLGNVSRQQALHFTQDVKALTSRTGFPSSVQMFRAASSTLSATGGDPSNTLALLEASAPFFRHKPDDLPVFASRLADLQRATGEKDLNKNAALMIAIQKQSRFVDLAAFKEAAPALMAVRNTDQSGDGMRAVRQGAAAFSALGTIIGDEEGSVTKTAIANLATKLERVYPENDVVGPKGDVLRKGTGLKTFDERLTRLQQSPHDQAVFMEGAEDVAKGGFRGPQVPIIRSFISNANSQIAQLYRENLSTLSADEAASAQVRENLKNATPELALAGVVGESAAAFEGFDLNSHGGRVAAARNIIEKTLPRARAGVGDMLLGASLTDRAALFGFDAANDPLREGMRILKAQDELLHLSGTFQRIPDAKLSPYQKAQLDFLEKQTQALQKLIDLSKENARQPSQAQGEAGRHREN